MNPTIGLVERMRWMSALGATAIVSVGAIVALSLIGKPLTAPTTISGSAAGSSAVLDRRIGTIAASQPNRMIQTIVQFDAGVAAAGQRSDVARVNGRVNGDLHIINGLR